MIPAIGVPILNRPDLLVAMLESIDEPFERLIVVDNGGIVSPASSGATVIQAGANLGVAASWNLIVKAAPLAAWWAIVNSDIRFCPGDLARLASVMPKAGLAMLGEMHAFGISAEVIDRVGYFDENFVPAYIEDIDYRYRCHLAGIVPTRLATELHHENSATYRSDEHLADENLRTYPENVSYYTAKWGGYMGQETHRTPFGRGGHIGDWRLDHDRLTRLAWR